MSRSRWIPILVLAGLCAACSSPRLGPVTKTPEEIALRFLEARSRGDAREIWNCFAGEPRTRRIYRDLETPDEVRDYEHFKVELDLGWSNPPLAPAETWEKLAERTDGALRVLVYRQGTEDEPDRGRLVIAAQPAGDGWLLAWVGMLR